MMYLMYGSMNTAKNSIANCLNSIAVDEAILERTFLDAFGLLAGNLAVACCACNCLLCRGTFIQFLINGTISKEVYEEDGTPILTS